MKNQVKHKYKIGAETVRIGNVQTIYTWNGRQKKPIVTHQHVEYTIPEPGTLDSVISEEDVEPTPNLDTLL